MADYIDLAQLFPTVLCHAQKSSCFFPLRYINYTGRDQLNNPAEQPFAIETEKDRAKLQLFVEFIESLAGVLDMSKVHFRWVRYGRPDRPAYVCSHYITVQLNNWFYPVSSLTTSSSALMLSSCNLFVFYFTRPHALPNIHPFWQEHRPLDAGDCVLHSLQANMLCNTKCTKYVTKVGRGGLPSL